MTGYYCRRLNIGSITLRLNHTLLLKPGVVVINGYNKTGENVVQLSVDDYGSLRRVLLHGVRHKTQGTTRQAHGGRPCRTSGPSPGFLVPSASTSRKQV